jgi:hypothetical protein
MAETNKQSEQITPEKAREIVAKTSIKTSGDKDYLYTYHVRKGRNYHMFDGKRYDVDTFYGACESEQIADLSNEKELCYEEIHYPVKGKILYRVWKYDKSYGAPCPACGKNTDIQFIIESQGVYMKCQWCKITTIAPPMNIESLGAEPENTLAEKVVEDPDVDLSFAEEVLKRTGQPSPFPVIRGSTRRKEIKTLKDIKH